MVSCFCFQSFVLTTENSSRCGSEKCEIFCDHKYYVAVAARLMRDIFLVQMSLKYTYNTCQKFCRIGYASTESDMTVVHANSCRVKSYCEITVFLTFYVEVIKRIIVSWYENAQHHQRLSNDYVSMLNECFISKYFITLRFIFAIATHLFICVLASCRYA